MHDWNALVREKLPEDGLPPAQRDEIVTELAGHLEEFYEEMLEQGLSDEESLDRALGQVTNWHDLAREIARSKRTEGKMNQRTRTFWLPGLINATSAVAFMAVLAQMSYQPKMILAHPRLMFVIWPLWIAGQPFLGAIGAYASRRAGGTRLTRLAAGLFPTIFLVVAMTVLIVNLIGGILSGRLDRGHFELFSVVKIALEVVVIPGLALLLGTLPFLRSDAVENLAHN